MSSKVKYLIPNGLTFLSLVCGIASLLASVAGDLYTAGALVVASYFLDSTDGITARRLNASSEFGLQLDSLVDMVSLGTAPAVLMFAYLNDLGMIGVVSSVLVVLLPLAGAFRLARFNLLPMKESSGGDSTGLTITTGGAIMALLVLADLSVDGHFTPVGMILPLIGLMTVLQVSTIVFPSAIWLFGSKYSWTLYVPMLVTLWQLPFLAAWYFWYLVYLILALIWYVNVKRKREQV